MSKKSTGTPRNRSAMSNEDFVVLWQSSVDKHAVADGYDLAFASANQRATNLRKKGVELKKFARVGKEIDVKGLNALAKKSVKA